LAVPPYGVKGAGELRKSSPAAVGICEEAAKRKMTDTCCNTGDEPKKKTDVD